MKFGRRMPAPALGRGDLATTWQLLSVLLDYPDESLTSRVPQLRAVAGALPEVVGEPITAFLDHVASADGRSLRAAYVETFDVTRRCCLYLTYFAHGDTRKRGLALVQVKQAYRRAGVEFDADELPDHLSVVLQFGAQYDQDTAWGLLGEHRAGIEVLRMALTERDSPWAPLLQALCATLPELKGDDAEKLARLIDAGPPSEEVGLDLAPYTLDPRLNPSPQTRADLGSSIPVGAPQ